MTEEGLSVVEETEEGKKHFRDTQEENKGPLFPPYSLPFFKSHQTG